MKDDRHPVDAGRLFGLNMHVSRGSFCGGNGTLERDLSPYRCSATVVIGSLSQPCLGLLSLVLLVSWEAIIPCCI